MFSKWRSRTRRTLGLRLAVWYAGIFAVSTLLVVALTYTLLASSLRQRDHEIVTATLQEYAVEYASGGLRALSNAIDRGQRAGVHERLFVRVLGRNGEAVFATVPLEWGRFDVERLALDPSAAARDGDSVWSSILSEERTTALEVASLRLNDGTLVQVGKSTESRDALLLRFRSVLGLVSLGIVMLGIAGGVVLTRSTLRPAQRLAGAVRSIIATGRTDVRVDTEDSGDPLDDIGALFNTMLERITRLVDGMRDALDNVAHDLKTPLARLRGRAEEGLHANNANERAEVLADCIADADKLSQTLDTLMEIAEAQAGTLQLELAPVALSALVAEVVELYADSAERAGLVLTMRFETEIVVAGDATRLRQLLANLVDNAIKYTPAGGRVTITGRQVGEDAVLSVEDTGVGIDPRDLPNIWERLYRGDRSRSSRGLGLGLSLVKAFAEVHGGRATVAARDGGGTVFEVHLPHPTVS